MKASGLTGWDYECVRLRGEGRKVSDGGVRSFLKAHSHVYPQRQNPHSKDALPWQCQFQRQPLPLLFPSSGYERERHQRHYSLLHVRTENVARRGMWCRDEGSCLAR